MSLKHVCTARRVELLPGQCPPGLIKSYGASLKLGYEGRSGLQT